MADKTNYAQSLMHMIKGNLGTGILAMPASFAHAGLISGIIGLPILCIIATYCVHLLVRSSQYLESKSKQELNFQYSTLVKHSFKSGPVWLQSYSGSMSFIVDSILLVSQLGVCCVYVVFVVDNLEKIFASTDLHISKATVYLGVLPVTLLLSYIRTLKRLAIASAFANLAQAIGIVIILEFLIRDIHRVDLNQRDNFRPLGEAALGFGSAMFAFEGISVVLPIYTRMRHSEQMSGSWGVINISYIVLLILYFAMGIFGYLRFGHHAKDSITLNLPPEPLYDGVRALFTVSVLLTYPLQFYVPNEIIWTWAKRNIMGEPELEVSSTRGLQVVVPPTEPAPKTAAPDIAVNLDHAQKITRKGSKEDLLDSKSYLVQEYSCRTIVVVITFILAISIPRLNLLMDLIGSVTGTALSLIIPAMIHLVTFWDGTHGCKKTSMIIIDAIVIIFGLVCGLSGSYFSFASIVGSFKHH